ncbi:ABC transporter permease [Lactobacillus sp.]|uniref:ABC transporter permease n=1 Tax=Lactobacillus sp. TaxID=1591 RepID=UPI00198B8BCB|nr:ABC transporter permease [Lactobacillus sp.]MBD5429247.1 ABC transporter permease [Lactobacillus sp.]
MKEKKLLKDAFQAISNSIGRYLAIILLIALGTFAFVGLRMTGPDMQMSGSDFFNQHNLADVTVTSNYGLNSTDKKIINKQKEVKKATFGYYQDAEIKGKADTIRIFSNSSKLSSYELVSGKMPSNDHEIALSYLMEKKYQIGQKVTIKKKGILKNRTYKVVGFVKSSEYLDKNQIGQTNLGTGQLTNLAVTTRNAFNSKTYQIARITFKNTTGLSAFSTEYRNRVYRDQEKLLTSLNKNRKAKYQAAKEEAYAQARQKFLAKLRKSSVSVNSSQVKMPTVKVNLPYPTYTVSSREDSTGYSSYRADAERVEVLAAVFPTFLFAVAALVSLTTMMRFVEEERTNIGLLKALGYSNFAVPLKFLIYSTSAAILGVILGAIGGYTFLPNMIIKAYTANSTLSTNYHLYFLWSPVLIALLVALFSTTGISLLTLHSTLREKPVSLLLPKAPKNGSRILLERIPFIWNHMSFSAKVTARNIFRYKSRMLMTIFGVAGCTGLLVMGFGIRDSLQGIGDIQYTQLQKNDVIALTNTQATKKQEAALKKELNSPKIKHYQAINYTQLTKHLYKDGATENVMMITPEDSSIFRKSINLRQRQDKKPLTLSNDSVVISEKLAKLLNAKIGSTIKLNDATKTYRFKVGGITEMYIGHYLFMNKHEYAKTMGKKYTTNAYLVTMSKKNDINQVSRQLMKQEAIQTIVSNSSNRRLLSSFTGSLNQVILILILISSILALVVIYNLTNINIAERTRELSTIRVLGFYNLETTMYIYRETIILSLIGILVGFGFGWWLHHFIITSLPPDLAMFNPSMYPMNFIMSALIPAVITLLLAFVVYHQIKKINMLDALQSVE